MSSELENNETKTEGEITPSATTKVESDKKKQRRMRREARKAEKARKEAAKSPLQNALETFAFVAFVFALALFIKSFVGQPVMISGDSMNDTFKDGNIVWANKVGYEPERYDVVIVESDKTGGNQFIKRIMALPGETIRIDEDNKIWITPADGGEEYQLDDPYGYFGNYTYATSNGYPGITHSVSETGSYTCADDEYFVIGDNRFNSTDSRVLGAFTEEEIVEHVVIRVWPLNKFGNFDKSNTE